MLRHSSSLGLPARLSVPLPAPWQPQQRSARRLSVWGLVLASAVAIGWAVVRLSATAPGNKAFPALFIGITIVLIALWERRAAHIGLFSPLASTLFAFFVMFSLVPLADLRFGNPWTYHSGWSRASWLAWGSLISLYAGYRAVFALRSSAERQVTRTWSSRTAVLFAVVMLGIGLISLLSELRGIGGFFFFFSHFASRRRYLQSPVQLLIQVSMAAPAILLVAGNWLWRPTRRRGMVLFLAYLPPALFLSTFLGQRWRAITIIMALAAVYHLGHRRIPRWILLAFFGVLIAGFIAGNLYRNVVGSTREVRSISGSDFYYNYLAGHELGQFRDFLATLEGTPSKLDFQHGRTFLSIIPGAPFPTGGYVYSSIFEPELYAAGTSVSNTLPGELYMNFGVNGVLIGMVAFGALIGLVETWFRRRRKSIGALLVYSYLLTPFAGVLRGDFTNFAGFSLVALASLFVALSFVERKTAAGNASQTGGGDLKLPVAPTPRV